MVRAPSFNPIPHCYIPSPSRLAAFGAFAPLTPSASLRSPSTHPSRIRVAGAGFARHRLPHPPLPRCPHHCGRRYPRLRSLALPPHFLPQQDGMVRAPSFNPIPHCYIPTPSRLGLRRLCRPHPSVSLRSAHRRPASASPVPAPASGFRIPPAPPHHRQRHYPRLRSLALPPHSLRQQGSMVRAPSFNTIPPCYIPSPSRLAAFGAFAPLNPSVSLRSPSAPPSHICVDGAGFARLRLPHPPCSDVRTTASATTHASGRWRSLHTPFANKAPWSGPHPSTPSLAATSPTLTARRLRRLCRPHPSVSLRSPSAPPSRIRVAGAGCARLRLPHPPCSSVHTTAGATTHASGRWHSLLTSSPNKAAWSGPHPSTPSLPATSPTLTARRLRRLCRPHPLRLAPLAVGAAVPHPRRRCGLRPPPASASPLLRCPHHRGRHYPRLRSLALPPHFLRQQDAMVRAPSFNTIPPCYIPSPSRLAAFGAFAPLNPSASLRSPSAVPHPRRRCGLRPPPASASPLLRCPHHRQRHYPRLRSLALPPHSLRQQGGMVPPHPSTPSLPATSPHPHGSPPSAPLPLSTPPPRSARRRRRRPTSASTARASPASGFRIPPAPMSAPPPAPLPTPPVAGAPSTLPSPTRRHGPGLILQHHPSPLHPPPSRLAAFGAFAALTPPSRSARRRHRRPASASPVRAAPASGFRIPLLQCPQHRGRHYPRLRSLALPTHFLRQQGRMVRAHPSTPSLPATSPTLTARRLRRLCRPHPLRLAPLAVGAAVPHPRRRRGLRPPPASASPCSSVHNTAGATTHASGRWHSLLTSFANKAAWSGPHPSTPSLPATSPHPHGSPPSAPLPLSTPPPRSARRRYRRPASASPVRASPASGFRIPLLQCPQHRGRHYPRLRSLALPTHFLRQQGRMVRASSFNTIPRRYIPHPHGSPPSAPLPPSPPPPRSARRRHRRPASASPARASPASGFRIPPAPMSAPPPAPLPTPPVAGAPSTLPSPTRQHGPRPILQHHPSLLYPLTLTARRLRRLCPSQPLRLAPLAVGAAVPHLRRRRGLRPPPASVSPLLRCPHHRQRHYPRLRSLALPPHSLRQQGAMVRPHPSTPSLPATSPHPHGSPPSAPLPPSPLRLAPLAVDAGVRTTAGATVVASGSVLRTTAVSSFSSDRHSIAVPAPIRGFRRRRFPLACTVGFIVPDRTARLWSSHHRVASLRRLRCSSPASSCAIAASPHAASFRHRSSHHHRCR